jgi:hypothetical protein
MVYLRVVSLIAVVPDSEWRTPTLIVAFVCARATFVALAIAAAASAACHILLNILMSPS